MVSKECELPIFIRVLEALPQDRLDWRPHERSKSAGELAFSMGMEARSLLPLARTGIVDFSAVPTPVDIASSAEAFQESFTELEKLVADMSDADWESEAVMKMGESEWKQPRGAMLWSFLVDLIHHRGQLSTYIRPMGGKVPSIYGPSADTQS